MLPERFQRPAFLDLTALAFSLMGFLGLIALVWTVKTGTLEVPRPLFLSFLAMTCAPFYVALVRPPKLPFLIPPVVAIFLLYPIASPHGVVYSTDPIFNFSFTDSVITSGFWSPGTGSAFAKSYSFYPLGNVFVGYVILTTGLPGASAYLWIQPVLRLLAVPAAVYAIGRRLFGLRVAALGLFFYLGTASILFNVPVQQGMGIVFVSLSVLALVILTQHSEGIAQRRAQILFALVAGGIVMTHHLSSYIFAAWLAVLAVLMTHHRFRPSGAGLRLGVLCLYFIALLNVYIVTFAWPIFFGHEQTLENVVASLIAPEGLQAGGSGQGLGRTFNPLEIAWLGGSVLLLLLLAVFSILRYRASRRHPFAVANGLVGAALIISTLPLIVTSLNYVPLRISEYANLIIAPFAAATLIRWTRAGLDPFARLARVSARSRGWLPPTVVLLITAALFMGGNLAPISMRMYFEDPATRTTDSPLFLGEDALRTASWARDHFGTARVWGDQLTIDVFAGFANMQVDFGSSRIFEGPTINASAWARLAVGDYVAVNRYMLTLRPNFFHEPARTTPLSAEEVLKFAADPHFALVYQDETFSIYRVMSKP